MILIIVLILFFSLYFIFIDWISKGSTYLDKNEMKERIKIKNYNLYSNVEREIEFLYFRDITLAKENLFQIRQVFPYSYMFKECRNNFDFDISKGKLYYPYLQDYISRRIKINPVEYFLKQVDEYIQNGIKLDYFHFSKKAILQYYIFLNFPFNIENFVGMIDNKFKFLSILQDKKYETFVKNVKIEDILYGHYFPNINQILDLQITEEFAQQLLVYVEDMNVKDRLFKKGLIHFYRCKNLGPLAINKKIIFLDSYHAAIDSLVSFFYADSDYKKNFKKVETKMILEALKTKISIQGNSSEELFNDYLRKKDYSINFDDWEEFA